MRERKHNKLNELIRENKEEIDIFKIYKALNEHIVKGNEKKKLEEKYEKEIIELIKKITDTKTLRKALERIEKENPFENGYIERSNFNSQVNDRKNLKNQEYRVGKTFNCKDKKGKDLNKLETSIQRNIMLSNKYNNIIGIPLFYEFPCNVSNGDNGKVPIDLITLDKKNNILYLIELKKCNASKEYISDNLSESTELFIRALFEVSTYYSFFTHLIKNRKKEVEKALTTASGIKINLDNVKIEKAILAPTRLYKDVYTTELKEELKRVKCFSIEIKDDSIADKKINCSDKLFKIK